MRVRSLRRQPLYPYRYVWRKRGYKKMGAGGFQKKWEILPLDIIAVLYKLYFRKAKCPDCKANMKMGMVNKKWSSKGFMDTADLSGVWSPLGMDFDITKVGLKCSQNHEHQYWARDLKH